MVTVSFNFAPSSTPSRVTVMVVFSPGRPSVAFTTKIVWYLVTLIYPVPLVG